MNFTRHFECGCKIVVIGELHNANIEYCPLHKTAPELYEACLTALGVMATLDQSKGWVEQISDVIQQAIAKVV